MYERKKKKVKHICELEELRRQSIICRRTSEHKKQKGYLCVHMLFV